MEKGLTPDEQEIMDLLVKAHNRFVLLEQTHPTERQEWIASFHGLQNVIGFRLLRREHPETFA